MNFICQGSQKKHVRVAISQKAPVRISWYAPHFEGFQISVKMHVMICLETVRASPRLLCPLPKARFACLGPTDHGSYRPKGFQDWFMFSRNKHGLKIDTWLKHPVGALKCPEIYQDGSIWNESTFIPMWITASNGIILPSVFSEIWC